MTDRLPGHASGHPADRAPGRANPPRRTGADLPDGGDYASAAYQAARGG